MQTYITAVKLNKIFPDIPDICCKCLEEKGTLFPFGEALCRTFPGWWVRIFPLQAKLCILDIHTKNLVSVLISQC